MKKNKKRLLIVVDLQYDFIDGKLAVPNSLPMVQNFAKFLDDNFSEFDHIAFTMDWHDFNHCSFKENGGTFPTHCLANSKGASIHESIIEVLEKKEYKPSKIGFYKKGTDSLNEEYSIFRNKEDGKRLEEIISRMNFDEIYVCGLVDEYCVYSTVDDLIDLLWFVPNRIFVLNNFIMDLGSPILLDYCNKYKINIIQ